MSLNVLRETVLTHSSIMDWAERAGFRKGRGGRWHCGFHDDGRASCTVRNGIIRCWTCGQSWNCIDLAMAITGGGYVDALRRLASETGIPWPSVGGELATDYEQEKRDRRDAEFWKRATLRRVDELLTDFKATLFECEEPDDSDGTIEQLTTFETTLKRASVPELLLQYRLFLQHDAEGVTEAVRLGREDAEDAGEVAAALVMAIARAQAEVLGNAA